MYRKLHSKVRNYVNLAVLISIGLIGLSFLFSFLNIRKGWIYNNDLNLIDPETTLPGNLLRIFAPQFLFGLIGLFPNLSILQYWMFYHAFMPLFLRKPKGKKAGIVKDAHTGKPVSGIIVSLVGLSHSGRSVNKKQITNKDGQYSFFEESGVYKITIDNPGYKTDIKISPEDAFLEKAKGLIELVEPGIIAPDINISANTQGTLSVSQKIDFLLILKFSILLLGLTTAVIVRTIIPDLINTAIVFYYIALIIAQLIAIKPFNSTGVIVDKETKLPIKGAVVAVYNALTKNQVATQISNANGQYSLVLEAGTYNMFIAKDGYTPYRTKDFKISSKALSPDIKILLSKKGV